MVDNIYHLLMLEDDVKHNESYILPNDCASDECTMKFGNNTITFINRIWGKYETYLAPKNIVSKYKKCMKRLNNNLFNILIITILIVAIGILSCITIGLVIVLIKTGGIIC